MNAKTYLEQLSKELHKPFSKKFQRRHVHAEAKDSCWSMDLVIMIEWAGVNDGNKYMLNVVDVFTRFAFSRPMKTKTAVDTYAAFIDIVETSKRKPKSIWVDEGKEFYNSTFKTWMKHNNATMYSTYGEQKSVICERFNRTLKSEMWRRFTAQNTRRWVDMLPKLIEWYNYKKGMIESALQFLPSSRTNSRQVRLSSISQNSSLLALVRAGAVFQFPCGWSFFQTKHGS